MTISRGQMERQLRMGGGIMDVVPREPALLGGIKKAVKKVGKTVKKVASSDVGKAALAAAALYYMPKYGIKAAGGLKPFLVGAPTNLTTGQAAFSGILGLVFSAIMRLELAQPGNNILAGNGQL